MTCKETDEARSGTVAVDQTDGSLGDINDAYVSNGDGLISRQDIKCLSFPRCCLYLGYFLLLSTDNVD
jgi:hypothetical protein